MIDKDLILQELLDRRGSTFDLSKLCFQKQLEFIQDPSHFKTLVTPRRAGKSVCCAMHLLNNARLKPKSINLYVTLSRSNAKRIIWPTLLEVNREHGLGGIPNETELSLKFPNGSLIYLAGAKDKREIEKFRGLSVSLVYLDEAQAFPEFIKDLIDEILVPTLFDTSGDLCLTGTPKPVPSGYFYEASKSSTWAHYTWQMSDNPWLKKKSGKTAAEIVATECKRKGVTPEDPSIQRECYGRWVMDLNSLVFRYNPDLNHYGPAPGGGEWSYILGIDIGFHDADAIAVIGWSTKEAKAFLVEEVIKSKQGITELAASIETLIGKYSPMRIVMDTGGLGRKIAEELRKRYAQPIVAAEKTRKFEFIELLNDALRTGRFMANNDSRFAHDAFLVEWDKQGDKPKVKDSFHSDICDAVLYAFRESMHWIWAPAPVVPKAGSPEWMLQQEANLVQQLESRLAQERSDSQGLDWSFLDDKG